MKLGEHIEGCERCSLHVTRLRCEFSEKRPATGSIHILQPPTNDYDYSGAFSRFEHSWNDLRSLYQKERAEAQGLFTQLNHQSAERQDLLIHNSRRFHTWGLFEELISRSRVQFFGDPQQSESLARLAIKVSGQLDPLQYGASQIQDLRARAWGYIANSLRLRFDLRGSQEAFDLAFFHLGLGTGDSFERAIILDLKASLLKDQRRFEDALRIMQRVIFVFKEFSENKRIASALIQMGSIYYNLDRPETSIKLLSEADALIDPLEDSRLLLALRHNRVDSLISAGRLLEASRLFGRSRELYRQFSDPSVENRYRWVKAKIAFASRHFAEAERLFQESKKGFITADSLYDSALVSLDLASLYTKQGRKEEAARLKQEAMPILLSQNIEAGLEIGNPEPRRRSET